MSFYALLLALASVFTLNQISVDGFVPPHRDLLEEEWEPVASHRISNGISFKYTPTRLHPEICRYRDEKTCSQLDEAFLNHTVQRRDLIRTEKKTPILVLLLQWEDTSTQDLIDPSEVEALWSSEIRSPMAPSGSISSFFRINSYGKHEIEAHVVPWMKTIGTETSFANAESGLSSDVDIRKAIEPLLEQLDEMGFDWSQYDQDFDGFIDSLVVLHSGYNAELGSRECRAGNDFRSRIWSHSQGPLPTSWRSKNYNVGLGGYTITSAYRGTCGNKIARIGVILHELLHSFGLPYLYDLSQPQIKGGAMGGAGHYDIMANPYGPNNDATFPGTLSPWSKAHMGWLTPFEVPYAGSYLAGASAVVEQVYKISYGFPLGEYLLIENRQAVLFDSNLPSHSGILIWHIDEGKEGNKHGGYPGQPPTHESEAVWPHNDHHYKVALLQADGNYDLEKGINNGDQGDFWVDGMMLMPGGGENPTFPNSDSYAYGQVQRTGIVIKVASASGTKMRFEVTGLGEWDEESSAMNTDGETIETIWGPMLEAGQATRPVTSSSHTLGSSISSIAIGMYILSLTRI